MTTITTINNKGINILILFVIKICCFFGINIIFERTENEIIAVGKAMMIQLWKEKAKQGEVIFAFTKKVNATSTKTK